MTVAARQTIARFLQRGKADTLTQPLYEAGQIKVPSAATYTLRDACGNVILTAVAAIVAGVATVSIGASDLDAYTVPDQGWREAWAFAVDGAPLLVELEVYFCRVAPVRIVTDEDLYRLHSDWRRLIPPGRASWDDPIDEAWAQLLGRLLGDAVIPAKVLNAWALRSVHLYWSAHLGCVDLSTGEPSGQGKWSKLADAYWKRAEAEYERLFLKRDVDDDGVANSREQVAAEAEVYLTNVPPRWPGWVG